MNDYPPPPGPPPGYNSYPPAPAHGQNPYQGQSQNPYNNNAQAPAQNNDYYNPPVDNGNGYVPPQNNNTGYNASYKEDTPFEEKFAVTKPKYNDLWAAVLFVLTMFGLIAVSVLSIRGYAQTRDINGSGIYDDDGNNFGVCCSTRLAAGTMVTDSLKAVDKYPHPAVFCTWDVGCGFGRISVPHE